MHITAKRRFWRYALTIVFLLVALILLVKVWPIISPFLVAILLAYLFSPSLKKMTNLGIPVGVSLPVLYFYLFVALYFILVITVPIILEQLRNLFAYLPEVFKSISSFLDSFSQQGASGSVSFDFQKVIDGIVSGMDERIAAYSAKIADLVFSLPQLLLYTVLAPILSYYLLRDRENIKNRIISFVSPQSRPEFLRIAGEVNHLVREFISGYLVIALVVAVIATLFYWLVGIDYPVVLGILMGIGDLIPYFGPIIAAIPAVLLAVTVSPGKTVIIIIGILLLQQLDSSVITPRIIGDRIGLHPVTTIFVVMAGGYLWGIPGAIFAIPLAAVLILIFKYLSARVFAPEQESSP